MLPGMTDPAQIVELRFPADPEFLRLARLTSADLGSRAGLDYEQVDDLRIAVSELCHLVAGGEPSGVVTLSFHLDGDCVVVEGTGPAHGAADSALARAIVAAVVDEHDVDFSGEQPRFRLVKRRPRSGGAT